MLVQGGAQRAGRGLDPRQQRWVDVLGAGHRQDGVQELRQRIAALDVDLDPQPHRLVDPRPGLRQVGRRRLQPRGNRGQPLLQRRVVAREDGKQGVADVLGPAAGAGPLAALAQLVDGQPSLVDDEVAVERPIGRQLVGREALHLADRGAMERDQLLDVLARAVREAVVVVMDAQVGGALRVELQHLAEPALDGAVEPRVRIGWCVHALLGWIGQDAPAAPRGTRGG